MVKTSQQVGGSIGTSLLSTIYATAVASYLTSHPSARGPSDVGQDRFARLGIGNCHHDESADGAAVTDVPGSPEPALAP